MSDIDDYEEGYQAGLRCDPCPDDASDLFHFGYGAALGMPELLFELTRKNNQAVDSE